MNQPKIPIPLLILSLSITLLCNCTNEDETKAISGAIFETLSHSDSGIAFANVLTENDSLNYFTYQYLYMGGGVAAGDINNDGLVDLYFTGNQVPNKLYLNKGNLKFKDISESAGVTGDRRWYTGVTMADVNADGFLDLYCAVSGKFAPHENQLFINNQDGTFTESAAEYGLADAGSSVQSTFFDYDKDGDLDLYVANYPPLKFNSPTFVYEMKMKNVKANESNHLFRNDEGWFTDVTESAGLQQFGLSLSATVGDLNNDSWPDLYVSNDFSSPDLMYINNQDGTFKEVIKEATAHTAFYGMGADIADFNNDGNLDIFQVDMDAQNNRRQKANMASMNIDLFWSVVNAGFHYQYMQNCMQLNSGVFEDGVPYFSNISRLTGTSSTDWSWGPVFADFDNDGFKDLFVSNGTRREINNNDFFNKLDTMEIEPKSMLELSHKIPSEKIDNFIFKNNGNIAFERANNQWGIAYKGFSTGVTYADLDNDGDLELITNNIDDKASIFENKSALNNNYLKVMFEGIASNRFGIGNRVYVKIAGKEQLQELTLSRGFQSSVSPILHFGVGTVEKIDEVRIVWPDTKINILTDVATNQQIVVKYNEATFEENKNEHKEKAQLFKTEQNNAFPKTIHRENEYDDFEHQILLPHKMSVGGPGLAVGDLNNDGLEDYYLGGAASQTGSLFFQTEKGFEKSSTNVFEQDRASEDRAAVIFDADFDGDNDLYVSSGGYEFEEKATALQNRLYVNDGEGNFTKAEDGVLPRMPISSARVYASDFDNDGKTDVLVLGRQVPKAYPLPATSYILRNLSERGHPKFELLSDKMVPGFKQLGMATSAAITDFNDDGWKDIIIVGEWMGIRAFKNIKTGFVEVSSALGLEDTEGWWWSINQGDFDHDGDIDFLLGNNGLNYKYKATDGESFDIYVNDFDNNTQNDIVLGYYSEGKQYPVRGRECSSQQIPGIKKKFESYQSYSQATLVDVYTAENLASSLHYKVKSFASVYLENENGKFKIHPLPLEVQFSSINQILIEDYDLDGELDAILAGNLYGSEVETPRNDASYGLYLKGNGKGNFEAISAIDSGFFVKGEVTNMATIQFQEQEYILVAKNNDSVQFIRRLKASKIN